MTHNATCMTLMEDPAKRFGEVITRIENARAESHKDMAGIFPILDGKVLNINVPGAFRGYLGIDHIDSGLVVFINGSRSRWRKAKVSKDGTKVLSLFGSSDSSKEFGSSRAGSSDGLCFRAVGNSATGHHEGVASHGTLIAKVIGKGSINKTNKLRTNGVY